MVYAGLAGRPFEKAKGDFQYDLNDLKAALQKQLSPLVPGGRFFAESAVPC
jgi:hypothetical protein